MERMQAPVCFVGHSHVPIAFVQNEVISYRLDPEIVVEPGTKVIVNVGSVGQPRDKDPRACYAIYDTEERKIWIRRARYDVDSVAAKIRQAGLPVALGERLKVGR
jgi:diadenosine tetraphosphatase ApaH/serine/threonine PP2A family protein phosphatase